MLYAFRLLVALCQITFSVKLLLNGSWGIGVSSPQSTWAIVHSWLYAVSGLCLIACPYPRLLGVLCYVFALAVPITGAWAMPHQCGDDGGGFFWLLVALPVGIVLCSANIVLGAQLWRTATQPDNDLEELRQTQDDGHLIEYRALRNEL